MSETLRSAFQGIWAHKLRSFLTMLGVIIGIAAIIGIVSTIQGTNEQIMQNLIGAGNNNVTVSLKQGNDEYYMDMGAPAGVAPVTDEQRAEILELEGVEDATFYLGRSWGDSVTRDDTRLDSATMRGIDLHYLNTTGYQVYEGRPFIETDYSGHKKVALLDETAAIKLFPDGDGIGKAFEIKGEPFILVGLVRKDESSGPVIQSFQDYLTYTEESYGTVFVPATIWPVLYAYDEPENCIARATSVEKMSDVGKQVESIMNRSVASNSAMGMLGAMEETETEEAEGEEATGEEGASSASSRIQYKATDLLEKARNKQELAASTNNLLIWVASIALLVGGIGVMNIMLVSVSERTAEIGLKKALGAQKKRILAQFLTESVLLTSMGGVLGVLAGIILARVIAKMSETPVAISIPAILLGVAFSMIIGIVFGLLPSIKASNLNPIDALRHE